MAMDDKVKVRIGGCATVSIDRVVVMKRADYDDMRKLIEAEDGNAIYDALMDYADIGRHGDFDDFELDTFTEDEA
jgi:hypothetical protein